MEKRLTELDKRRLNPTVWLLMLNSGFDLAAQEPVAKHNKTGVLIEIDRNIHSRFANAFANQMFQLSNDNGEAMEKTSKACLAQAKEKLPEAIAMRQAQDHLDDLANACFAFADKNGTVFDKGSNQFSAFVHHKYKDKKLEMECRAQCSGYSNGSATITVKHNGATVFDGTGNFMSQIFNFEAEIYVSGQWERIVLSKKKKTHKIVVR